MLKADFEILDTKKEEKGTSILLRHKNTGLKIDYNQCETENPGFSFCFKTPVEEPYLGTSHVLEHCVLQGSKKYDVDFLLLKDFSFYSDFNGITEADNTTYYFYSPLESECFKLMLILADFLFFPLLLEEVFMQENFRVEFSLDGDGRKKEICGVVYNEMKTHSTDRCFIGGIDYKLYELTLEKIKDYHKKYYRPDNCVFMYNGTASVEEVLENLEKFIPELEEKYSNSTFDLTKENTIQNNTIVVPPKKSVQKIKAEYLSQFSEDEYKEKLERLHTWQNRNNLEKALKIMEPLAVQEYQIEISEPDEEKILRSKERYFKYSKNVQQIEYEINKFTCSIFIKASEPFTKKNFAEHAFMFFLRFYLSRNMRKNGKVHDILNNYDLFENRFVLTVNRTANPKKALQQIESLLEHINEYIFTDSDLILTKTLIFSLFFSNDFRNDFYTHELFNLNIKDVRDVAFRYSKLFRTQKYEKL